MTDVAVQSLWQSAGPTLLNEHDNVQHLKHVRGLRATSSKSDREHAVSANERGMETHLDNLEEAMRFTQAKHAGRSGQAALERRAQHAQRIERLRQQTLAEVSSSNDDLNTFADEETPPNPSERSQLLESSQRPQSRTREESPLERTTESRSKRHKRGLDTGRQRVYNAGGRSHTNLSRNMSTRTAASFPGYVDEPSSFAHRFNLFLRRLSWNRRNRNYIFSRNYLRRKPSFVTPDESTRIVVFKSKEIVSEHPEPTIIQIERPPRKQMRYMHPVKKPSLSSMSSVRRAHRASRTGSRSVRMQPSLKSQDWVKISLPVKARSRRGQQSSGASSGVGRRPSETPRSARNTASRSPRDMTTRPPSPVRTPRSYRPQTPDSWVTVRSMIAAPPKIPPPAPIPGESPFLERTYTPRGSGARTTPRETPRGTPRTPRTTHGLGNPRTPIYDAHREYPDIPDVPDVPSETDRLPNLHLLGKAYAHSAPNSPTSPTSLPSSYRPESWRKSAQVGRRDRLGDVDVVEEAMEFVGTFKTYLERSLIDRTSKERKRLQSLGAEVREFDFTESEHDTVTTNSFYLSPGSNLSWTSHSDASSRHLTLSSASNSMNDTTQIGGGTLEEALGASADEMGGIDLVDLTPPKPLSKHPNTVLALETVHSLTELADSLASLSPSPNRTRPSPSSPGVPVHRPPHLGSRITSMINNSDFTSNYSSSESLVSAEFMRMTPVVQDHGASRLVLGPGSTSEIVLGPIPLRDLPAHSDIGELDADIRRQQLQNTDELLKESPPRLSSLATPRGPRAPSPVSADSGLSSDPVVGAAAALDEDLVNLENPAPLRSSNSTGPSGAERFSYVSLGTDSNVSAAVFLTPREDDSAGSVETGFESASEIVRRSSNREKMRVRRSQHSVSLHFRKPTIDSMWEAEDEEEEDSQEGSH